MDNTLTKEQVKEVLAGKKIVRIEFSPYAIIVFDDHSELEIIPEQVNAGGVTYLDISFRHFVDGKKDNDVDKALNDT
ncbi:MAG: hypothetical protein ACUZ8H_13860 [Candidatus Anammoxibacter sp.]